MVVPLSPGELQQKVQGVGSIELFRATCTRAAVPKACCCCAAMASPALALNPCIGCQRCPLPFSSACLQVDAIFKHQSQVREALPAQSRDQGCHAACMPAPVSRAA